MSLLRDLASTGVKRSLYRAPRYMTQPPIKLGRVFGPVRYQATALPWRGAFLTSNILKSKRESNKFFNYSMLPMAAYASGSDRRMWHPLKYKSAVTVYGTPAVPTDVSIYTPDWEKLMNPPQKIDWRPKLSTQLKNAPWWYGFVNADKVWICLQRKMRREIMHAFGIAGKSGSQKSPHYGPYSRVRC